MSGVRSSFSKKVRESIGADVNISSPAPMQTLITGYNNAISLPAQPRDGWVFEIVNVGTGGAVLVDSDINLQGAATDQLSIANNATAKLMYIKSKTTTERFRLVGGSATGITLQ